MAIGVRTLIEERVERRLREAEVEMDRKPSITVEARDDGLHSAGDTPRAIPIIPFHLAQMSKHEARDLVQW